MFIASTAKYKPIEVFLKLEMNGLKQPIGGHLSRLTNHKTEINISVPPTSRMIQVMIWMFRSRHLGVGGPEVEWRARRLVVQLL